MRSQVQGLKACRFQARVKLAPPYLARRRVVLGGEEEHSARVALRLLHKAAALLGQLRDDSRRALLMDLLHQPRVPQQNLAVGMCNRLL